MSTASPHDCVALAMLPGRGVGLRLGLDHKIPLSGPVVTPMANCW
jgi:hypothetical protein